MKKILLGLFSISLFARAENDMESVTDQMSEVMDGVTSMADKVMNNMSYKMKIMLFWSSMSTMHKLIVSALGVLVIFWILCKLMHHKKGSCSCGCSSGKCSCHR